MALQEQGIGCLNKVLKELKPQGTFGFPCAGYSSYCTDCPEDIVPWHWHEDLEMIYVTEGELEVKVPLKSFFLREGDSIVINSNILHYAAAIETCRYYSLVFNSELIVGTEHSVFAEKYVVPLCSCNSFSYYYMRAGSEEIAVSWFMEAFEALAEDRCGFEFIVREKLSRICLFLYGKFMEQISVKDAPLSQDNVRVKKMLSYIHKNFLEDVSLKDISRAADISERECLRCFQKTIQISPVQYLLKYRIMQGAEMLLADPDSSISEIASMCGFDSPSNFSKMFRRFYNCTPREYRSSNS